MNVFSETGKTVAWIVRVNAVFAKIRPVTTTLLILSSSTLRFVQVLASFLPLKVILLAASAGIPSYFAFFIAPDQKSRWIVILAFGAVGFYILSLLLERWIRWLSEAGSLKVLQGANEIAVSSRSQTEASSFFAKFGGVLADSFVVIVALTLLSLINHYLLYGLLLAFLIQYLVAILAFRFGSPYETKGIKRVLIYNLSGYLSTCSTISFLLSFFILLYPFVYGSGGNLLFCILAILLLRQTLSALSSVVGTGVGLRKKQFQIDPLVFRHKQIVKPEHKSKRTLRVLFDKPARERIATEQLNRSLNIGNDQSVEVESTWQDSPINKMSSFLVSVRKNNDDEAKRVLYFQHQVASKNMLSFFEHEDFLFEHVRRQDLSAPAVRAVFNEGDFICRIYDYGHAKPMSNSAWKKVGLNIVSGFWAVAPPATLITSYLTSHPILPARLSRDFLTRVSVAIDTPDEKAVFDEFLNARDRIVGELSHLPLFIYNPDLRPANVVESDEGYLVMAWGRWKLEPIGFGMPANATSETIETVLGQLMKSRHIHDRERLKNGLSLVQLCHELEKTILREHYKKSLIHMRRILKNPLAAQPDSSGHA